MSCRKNAVDTINLINPQISNKQLCGFLCPILIGLCLILSGPLYGQGSLAETTTTLELQEQLSGSADQAAPKPQAKRPKADANRPAEPNRNAVISPNAGAVAEQQGQETPAAVAPLIVRTSPKAFANDVESSLWMITVTFDQPMMDKSWSWTGSGEMYPKTTGQPSYDPCRTTCKLPVKLEPGKVYRVGINSPSYQNFKSVKGIPAKRYVILFATRGNDGEPTPIPEDMLKEARTINEQNKGLGIERSVTEPETPLTDAGIPKDTNIPDINDFNDFQKELNRINAESRSEERRWLGRTEQKDELARAIDKLVTAELSFIRKIAESEGADKTTKAIDLVLKQRQERLEKLATKLDNEAKEERQQQVVERRRAPRAGGQEPSTRKRPRDTSAE